MSKKRTKMEKQNAKHSFTISWNPKQFEAKSKLHVKGQISSNPMNSMTIDPQNQSSVNSAQIENINNIKRNIAKSLILAGIILGTQVVLYFFWK